MAGTRSRVGRPERGYQHVAGGGMIVHPVPRRRPLPWMAVMVAAAVVVCPLEVDPVPVAATLDSQVTPEDQAKILKAHNDARGEVGAPPLTWDAGLASDAQAWVDFLVANRGGEIDHGTAADPLSGSAKNQGENLNRGRAPGDMTVGWYAEKSKVADAAHVPFVFSAGYGHYSQMVWSDTTSVGCGTAVGPLGPVNSCRYSPPGNFEGEPPVKGQPAAGGTQTGDTQANGDTQNGGTPNGDTQANGTQGGGAGAPQVVSATTNQLPCSSAARSPDGQRPPAVIEIVNNSSKPVTVSWLDQQGAKMFPITAEPGGTATLDTFAGDVWVAETDGTCITALEGAGTITFG